MGTEPSVGVPFVCQSGSPMPSSARPGSSSPSRHSSSAASIIHAYTLIKLHNYAMLPPSAAFPSEFSHSDCRSYFSSVLFCRFSGFTLLFFLLFHAFYVWQTVLFVLSIMRLVDMYHFHANLLQIPDVRLSLIYHCSFLKHLPGR